MKPQPPVTSVFTCAFSLDEIDVGNVVLHQLVKVAVHLVHSAVAATFLDVQLVPYIVEALLAFFALPDFLKSLVVDVALIEPLIQQIGATAID